MWISILMRFGKGDKAKLSGRMSGKNGQRSLLTVDGERGEYVVSNGLTEHLEMCYVMEAVIYTRLHN
jgi:hypothetical protein